MSKQDITQQAIDCLKAVIHDIENGCPVETIELSHDVYSTVRSYGVIAHEYTGRRKLVVRWSVGTDRTSSHLLNKRDPS